MPYSTPPATVDGGRHLRLGSWLLAAGVTVLFNLDSAVVLLTPLYVRLAYRHGDDVMALAFMPALLHRWHRRRCRSPTSRIS